MRFWLSALVVTQLLGPREERTTREGNELYREGKLDEALASYTKAQVDHPDAAELHYNIGNVHYRKEDAEKAVEEYRTVLQANDELKRRAHYNIGNVHYNAQEWREAVDAYRNALRIDPKDIEARQNLELALQKLNQQQQDQQERQQEQTGSEGQEGRDQDPEEEQKDRSGESPNQQAPESEGGSADRSNAQPTPMEMSPEQAEQILQALAHMEQAQQLEQQQKQKATAKGKGRYW